MRKDIIEILDFEEEKPKVGRPKKADIEKAAKEMAEEDRALADDLKRIS